MSELQYFGTDGIRGDYGTPPIAPKDFEILGHEYAQMVWFQTDERPRIIVARDTRPSSPTLARAVCNGARQAGALVWDIGVAPTPVAAWLAQKEDTHAIVTTASHNPANQNGFKPFDAGGWKYASQARPYELEQRYDQRKNIGELTSRAGGAVMPAHHLTNWYIDAVVNKLGGPGILNGKTLIVDGGNGAAHHLAPRLFRRLGAEVIEFACDLKQPINKGTGAHHLEGAQTFMKDRRLAERLAELSSTKAFLGVFAEDGDADRTMGVSPRRLIINGNHWMYMLATNPKQDGMVGTRYTNTGLRERLTKEGVKFFECENGDINVTIMLMELQKNMGARYSRGGEFTGHLTDLEHLSSGDGLFMGGLMAVYLATTGRTLDDTYEELPLWPQAIRGLAVDRKISQSQLDNNDTIQRAAARLREEFGGRVILRPSGTEALVRVFLEVPEGDANALTDELASIVQEQLAA